MSGQDAATSPKGGYTRSRCNAVKYGVEIHGLLPSKGPDKCVFASRCHFAKEQRLRSLCIVGGLCPDELRFYEAYVQQAMKKYIRARQWLGPSGLESVIHDLAIFELRRARLSARMADDGFLREVFTKNRKGSWIEVSLAAGRYAAAIDNGFDEALRTLLFAPEEEPMF